MKTLYTVIALCLVAGCNAATKHATLPDPKLTPGATNPAVTQATIKQTICKPGYTTTVRNVTTAEKGAVMARYGLYLTELPLVEIDHFFSLEIGGSNDITNLWPQYYVGQSGYLGAREKDTVETHEKSLVCNGTITLAQAQIDIRNWVAIYKKLHATKGGK